MKRFFSSIRNFFASLFTPDGQKKINVALGQAENLVQTVLPIVEAVSAATPNKTDDEVVAVIRRYAVPVTLPPGPMTDETKGAFLLKTAAAAAKHEVSSLTGVPDSVIDLAVQLAYTAFRAATR